MSWFSSLFSSFKFPAPADASRLQERRLLDEPPETKRPETTSNAVTLPAPTTAEHEKIQAEGRRRNKIILAAGLAFFGLSTIITRRALARRRLASQAAFYNDAPTHNAELSRKVSGGLEAVEALNIATINVLSVALIATGGTLWYLDVNSLADARRMIRGGVGIDGNGMTEEEANKEIEETIASILARKDAKASKK